MKAYSPAYAYTGSSRSGGLAKATPLLVLAACLAEGARAQRRLPPLPKVDPLVDGFLVRSVELPPLQGATDDDLGEGDGDGEHDGGSSNSRRRLIMYDFRPAFPPYTKKSLDRLLLFPEKEAEEMEAEGGRAPREDHWEEPEGGEGVVAEEHSDPDSDGVGPRASEKANDASMRIDASSVEEEEVGGLLDNEMAASRTDTLIPANQGDATDRPPSTITSDADDSEVTAANVQLEEVDEIPTATISVTTDQNGEEAAQLVGGSLNDVVSNEHSEEDSSTEEEAASGQEYDDREKVEAATESSDANVVLVDNDNADETSDAPFSSVDADSASNQENMAVVAEPSNTSDVSVGDRDVLETSDETLSSSLPVEEGGQEAESNSPETSLAEQIQEQIVQDGESALGELPADDSGNAVESESHDPKEETPVDSDGHVSDVPAGSSTKSDSDIATESESFSVASEDLNTVASVDPNNHVSDAPVDPVTEQRVPPTDVTGIVDTVPAEKQGESALPSETVAPEFDSERAKEAAITDDAEATVTASPDDATSDAELSAREYQPIDDNAPSSPEAIADSGELKERITTRHDDDASATTVGSSSPPSTTTAANNNINKDANRQFVDGLDEIEKLFESVEVPDELDVGADGSSMQDVLVGQGLKILWKRFGNFGRGVRGKFERAAGSVKGLLGGEDEDDDEEILTLDSLLKKSKEEDGASILPGGLGRIGHEAEREGTDGPPDKPVKEKKKPKEKTDGDHLPLIKSPKARAIWKFARRKWERAKLVLGDFLHIFEGADDDDDIDDNFGLGDVKLPRGAGSLKGSRAGGEMPNFDGRFGSEVDESFLKSRYEAMMKQQQKGEK